MAKKRYVQAGKRPQKAHAEKINFVIDKMDNLGQGVNKQQGKVSFIAKTLPGESGQARVLRTRKGVMFAQVEQLETPAENRCEPSCPHFSSCPACDYLHTDYASELTYKRLALADYFRQLNLPEQGIEVIAAPERLHYRNRLQLHYRHKYIGMVDGLTDQIVEIPHCQIIRPELQSAFDALYADKNWTKTHTGGGHVELYWRDDEIMVNWDEAYAQGGFTQVNAAMNEKLCDLVTECLAQSGADSVLDLFSGAGNLTADICAQKPMRRIMVDYAASVEDENFIALDLLDEDAFKRFQRQTKNHADAQQFDCFVVDPPRKGFIYLPQWVKKYKPQQLLYVSCNAATLARDLQALTEADIKFTLEHVFLLDLFPATHHFEVMVVLTF